MDIFVTSTPDGWIQRKMVLNPTDYNDTDEGDSLYDLGRGGSLLFLNGRGDYLEKYAETLRDFARKGWRAESFDWRGQGGSGRFVENMPLLGHVDDFAGWLDDLTDYARIWRDKNPGPHVMMGHSMGGHLLLRALAEGRVVADAAILVAPMLGLVANGVPHAVGSRIARAMCSMGLSHRPLWPDRRNIPALEEVVRSRLTHSVERFEQEKIIRFNQPGLAIDAPSWGWLNAAYQSIDILATPNMLEEVDIPVLILATRADKLVSPSAIEAAALRLPQVHVHFYGEETAHEILRERDCIRNDALSRIDEFLEDTVFVNRP